MWLEGDTVPVSCILELGPTAPNHGMPIHITSSPENVTERMVPVDGPLFWFLHKDRQSWAEGSG